MDINKDEQETKDISSMARSISEAANKSWSCRQFVVLVFSIGAVVLAYFDPSFRPTFGNLVNLAVGGYLGQMIPRSKI